VLGFGFSRGVSMGDQRLVASTVLNSWKEIASYVGRGVRTVQRWESDLGMPVRRPRAKSRSAVVAMADEIDQWLRSAPTTELNGRQRSQPSLVIEQLRQTMSEHTILRNRCDELRGSHRQALHQLINNLEQLTLALQQSRSDQASAGDSIFSADSAHAAD
jgi:phage terminase Nu1 subunit (DNA packaging protein)